MAKLAELYKAQGYTARHQLVRPLIQRTLEDYKGIAEYSDAIKGSLTQIRAIGYEIKDEWLITSIFMHKLGLDYKDLIDIIFNTRPRNNRGQFEELDFNNALRQLINIKKRYKDRDSSKDKAIFIENFKKRKID